MYLAAELGFVGNWNSVAPIFSFDSVWFPIISGTAGRYDITIDSANCASGTISPSFPFLPSTLRRGDGGWSGARRRRRKKGEGIYNPAEFQTDQPAPQRLMATAVLLAIMEVK